MAEDKNGFVLYKDLIHTVKKMPKDKQAELFMHILEYVNDLNPQTDDLLIELTFEPIKQSLKRDLQKCRIGRFHWNWKNGKTPENKKIRNSTSIKIWRLGVFERDNFTCQHCKIKGGELNAHHIKPFALFPDLRLDVDNGLTLCKTCHVNEHKKLRNER